MRTKVVCICLPDHLLAKIDKNAKANYESRSSFIRHSIALRLNGETIVKQPTEEDKLKAIFDQAKFDL